MSDSAITATSATPADALAPGQDSKAGACCPRCNAAFHCGARDTAPCACSGLQLSPELRAALQQHYRSCLCLRCLLELRQSQAACRPGIEQAG